MKAVTIYTSTNCEYCHQAKEFFDEKSIPYTEINISKDKEARKELMKKGFMSVPVIIINEKEMVGFDPIQVSEILEIQ